MNLAYYADTIDKLHQENLQFLKAQRYRNPQAISFGTQVEADVTGLLRRFGYLVKKTRYHDHQDLKVIRPSDRRFIMIEVKGSLSYYLEQKRAYRYQAHIHQTADLYIFACVDPDGWYHHFILPPTCLGNRSNIAIWSQDPASYAGIWKPFYNAWSHLGQAFADLSQPYIEQLSYISGVHPEFIEGK